MGRISKFTKEEKLELIQRYKNGEGSLKTLATSVGIVDSTLMMWVHKYDLHGEEAFTVSSRNHTYTREFKDSVVQEHLDGYGSLRDIATKYNISSGMLSRWVKMYNDPEGLKDYMPQGDVYTMKNRKTTQEERIKIVKYCLEHEKDYKLTAMVFDVPSANVYGWVKKYIQKGEEGLSDKRGCHKKDEELDEVSLLKRQLKQMEREYEILKLENELLKKVQEVERRRFGEKVAMKQSLSLSGKKSKR